MSPDVNDSVARSRIARTRTIFSVLGQKRILEHAVGYALAGNKNASRDLLRGRSRYDVAFSHPLSVADVVALDS